MADIPQAEHDAAGDGVEKNVEDARQGVTTGHMRWVLRISVALAILAIGAAYVGVSLSRRAPATAHQPAQPPAVATSAGRRRELTPTKP
jgi:hypothetical protein